MKRWLTLAAVLMLCAWAPFFYAELTSSPKEHMSRMLPEDRAAGDDPATTHEQQAAALEAEKTTAEPEPEKPSAPVEKPPELPALPSKEALAAKSAEEPQAQAVQKPGDSPVDEAEATEPEGEAQNDPPVPPPSASGPSAALKGVFDTQARDPLWAADSEKQIRALFRTGDLPAELLQSASCRSAVCLIELRWTRERAPAYVSLYENVRKDFASEVGVEPVGAPDEKGQQQVNLYLARKGYTVADLTK